MARREAMKPLSLLTTSFLALLLACLTSRVAFSADASEGAHPLVLPVIISLFVGMGNYSLAVQLTGTTFKKAIDGSYFNSGEIKQGHVLCPRSQGKERRR